MYFGVKTRLTFTSHLKLKIVALLHDFMSEKNQFFKKTSFPSMFVFLLNEISSHGPAVYK